MANRLPEPHSTLLVNCDLWLVDCWLASVELIQLIRRPNPTEKRRTHAKQLFFENTRLPYSHHMAPMLPSVKRIHFSNKPRDSQIRKLTVDSPKEMHPKWHQNMTSTHLRESKIVLDSAFLALGFQIISRSWIQDSLWVKLRFRIPVISRILDSLSFTLDSKAQDSISHYRHKFPGFWNLYSLTWGEWQMPVSGLLSLVFTSAEA